MKKRNVKMYKVQLLGVKFSSIFATSPLLYMFFFKYSIAIDIVVHFYAVMKSSEYECNPQLSYLILLSYIQDIIMTTCDKPILFSYR